jgi:hypothetical protein
MHRAHDKNLASSRYRGERCVKDTDHHNVHSVVHLADHRSAGEQKSWKGQSARFGRGVARGLGWSDPTVRRADAPNVIRGVAPAQADVSCGRDADAMRWRDSSKASD